MIGVKSIAIGFIAAVTLAVALAKGLFAIDRIEQVTVPSAFAIGLFASAGAALLDLGGTQSRASVTMRGRLVDGAGRELPRNAQRVLVAAVLATLGLATFSTDATARIASVPSALSEPSRAAYCLPEAPKEEAPAPVAPPPPPVDQAGCALVKRAFALGYAKSLGSCAPREAPKPIAVAAKPKAEVCDRRELDEPFLHYMYRRVVGAAQGASPVDATSKRIDEVQTRIGYMRDLFADIKHSITGTPHGAHHIWITLPDPHPSSRISKERCSSTFADLPLWPNLHGSALVEHVLGQLLFATRFGTPASCSDYTIHWGASNDACARLAADPVAFLVQEDALPSIRTVLDRRHRQAELRDLALVLGRTPTVPAPPARAIASVACFAVGPGKPNVSGRDFVVDGETIEWRLARATSLGGPLDLYAQLAQLLAGTTPAPHTSEPFAPDATFSLAQLEPLVSADPFAAETRALLAQPDIAAVYPFDLHLHAFVEGFRRVYFAQRGRL